MAAPGLAVMVQRENEKGKKENWRSSRYDLDQMSGAISITAQGMGKKWTITIRPEQLDSFAIDLISDTQTLAMMYGGGLLGYGVAALMGRWVKLPVMVFSQPMAPEGEKWMQIRTAGMQPRKQMQELATKTATFLRERGYSGEMPNLNDETLWKANTGAMLAGCGLVIVALLFIFGAIFLLASMSN